MPTEIVILGAGFGGLELSTRLSEELHDRVHVTLIDKNDAFVFGFAKLDVLFGHKTFDEVHLHYSHFAKPSVDFRQETILSIDPGTKRVVTDKASYDAEILVVALGADLDPGATPGLIEHGNEFYSPEGANSLRETLQTFGGGNCLIAVLGGFFKCPPAPYETCFMLHDFLTQRGLRDTSTIQLVTPLPKPIPISDEVSNAIMALLDERGIGYSHATWTASIDPGVAHLKDGRDIPFDLLLGVPVHKAPAVVIDSGLTEEDAWIAVDKATLATKWADVYALGDVASVPVPRAGAIAEGEAATVADVIIAKLTGGPAPAPYPGAATCYVEMGDRTIGKVDVNFLSGPAPTAVFSPPSMQGAEEKRAFGATRRQRWFGLP